MSTQTLFLEDKPMLDPLSLLDYPEAKGVDEIYIMIKGDMPRESKKWDIYLYRNLLHNFIDVILN